MNYNKKFIETTLLSQMYDNIHLKEICIKTLKKRNINLQKYKKEDQLGICEHEILIGLSNNTPQFINFIVEYYSPYGITKEDYIDIINTYIKNTDDKEKAIKIIEEYLD